MYDISKAYKDYLRKFDKRVSLKIIENSMEYQLQKIIQIITYHLQAKSIRKQVVKLLLI